MPTTKAPTLTATTPPTQPPPTTGFGTLAASAAHRPMLRRGGALAAALACLLGRSTVATAAEPDFQTVERQFRELPPQARRLTGPLFWLHGTESPDRLELYARKMAEGGNGCFTAESRPHNDWLGPNWFRDLGLCLAAAKSNHLQMWIFDEKWWPSQGVAGKVPPQYAAKRLVASARAVEGPSPFAAEGYGGARHVATLAGRLTADGKVDGRSLRDLKAFIRAGQLRWPVPPGKWQIMKFTHQQAPGLGQGGGTQLSVDGASRDCVDWFIQTVYQPHYDHFKADFGKTIRGFFYDEPETRGDWGTELEGTLAGWGVDWKRAYVAYKFELAGEEQAAARYQYLTALAETWGRTMYGGMSKWCHQHGVVSMGHFMEHGNLYLNPEFCAGDMMRLQKYSDMGGIDAVFSQFVWGKRVAYDPPCWQTPKLGSSISHAYGKPDDVAFVEIFGARGQDLTYPEMKWWADHMQVSGINFLIPHSFNPRAPYDTDCPPYFYNGGFEPRWPLYRVFADYTSRLSLLLSGGRHVCPVALLVSGNARQVGRMLPPDALSAALQDALYDCDWLPLEVFENDVAVAGKQLKLRQERYRVLIVPPVEVIPYATLAKTKAFFDAGGVVVGHGFLPTRSATLGKTAADIAQLCAAIWGKQTNAAGGRAYLLPEKPTPEEIQKVLAAEAGVQPTLEVLAGTTDHWLHVLHRVKAGRDVFFIANQNHLGAARTFRLRVTAAGVPECWDPMRNEVTTLPCHRNGPAVELALTLEPNESVLLVFQPKQRALPPRLSADAKPQSEPIPVLRVATTEAPAPTVTPAGRKNEQPSFEGCSWVWFPEGNPATSAPPGTRFFRKPWPLPADRPIQRALCRVTCDNDFTLFVNGQQAGASDRGEDSWRRPATIDITKLLRAGPNQLAILAVNGSDKPNPAGLLGRFVVEFDDGATQSVGIDPSWKTSNTEQSGWTDAAFNDAAWPPAKALAQYGQAPWGDLDAPVGGMTLSPVKAADPFLGRCQLPNLPQAPVYLELETLAPETAARVTVNGQDAGGIIGKPLRLNVSRFLKPGANTIRIEPFAPQSARLATYE
jgi:hypothetical protein